MLQTRVSKLYSICSTPEMSERNFCDGLKIKFTSPLGGIQQAGAPKTAVKSVRLLVFIVVVDFKRLQFDLCFIITNFHTELNQTLCTVQMLENPYHG